jgi:hypothetical protein
MELLSRAAPRPTKACLQSPAGKEKRDQTKESSKAGIGLLVASCDASECLEMAEEVFDQMAPFVHFCIVRDALGFTAATSAYRLPVHTGTRAPPKLQCCIAIGEISHAAATNFNQKM